MCCIAPSILIPDSRNAGRQARGRALHPPDGGVSLRVLYGKPERPQVCINLRAMEEMCGETRCGRR